MCLGLALRRFPQGCVRIQRLLGENRWESADLTGLFQRQESSGRRFHIHIGTPAMNLSVSQWFRASLEEPWQSWPSDSPSITLQWSFSLMGTSSWCMCQYLQLGESGLGQGTLSFSRHCMSSDPVIIGCSQPCKAPFGHPHTRMPFPLLWTSASAVLELSQQPSPVFLWRTTARHIKFQETLRF